MKRWNLQLQKRDARHNMLELKRSGNVDVEVAVRAYLVAGYTISDQSAISITLRSQPLPDGTYLYAHFWEEGADI